MARLGGKEFVIIFQNCNRDAVVAASEQLRAALTAYPMALKGGVILHVTASIGIAVSENNAPDLDSMLRAADEALYKAKSLGRNRVVIHEPSVKPKAPGKPRGRSSLSAATI